MELGGKTATGLRVPPEVVADLGSGKRPAVTVTLNGHSYRSTIAVMGGAYFLPLSAENRTAAGAVAGDEVEVDVALDTAPRVVDVPPDLRRALDAVPAAANAFDALSYSHQRAHVMAVEGAKVAETRERRITKVVAALRG
ncbi:MAG: hypothetical protein JWP11_162 [Frankiales bacterium]|nr:hypothetical protein [Frankiales bacterium]